MKYFSLLLLFFLASPLIAEPKFGEISFIDGGRTKDGEQLLGINIMLEKGWHSYWRLAGQNGLDPVFDLSVSENLKSYEIHWPEPHLVGDEGVEAVGYEENVQLVISMKAKDEGQSIKLSLKLDIGVCDTQCVPIHRDFDMELNAGYSIDGIGLAIEKSKAFDENNCAGFDNGPSTFVLYDRGNKGAILTPSDQLRELADIKSTYEVDKKGIHQLCE